MFILLVLICQANDHPQETSVRMYVFYPCSRSQLTRLPVVYCIYYTQHKELAATNVVITNIKSSK
jgi:hypothetical protein